MVSCRLRSPKCRILNITSKLIRSKNIGSYCIPLCVMYDGIWPVGIAAMIVAYMADAYSTARFGRRLVLYEANVIMRYLFRRYSIRLALALHTIWYFAAIVGVSVLLGSTGQIQWHVMLGLFMFGLAACHIWCAAGNIQRYSLEELA